MTIHSNALPQFGLAPVSDYMQTDVATLRADATAEEAIALFEDYHISGAPVLNSSDELVGVLTASDIARTDHVAGDLIQTERSEYYLQDTVDDSLDDAAFDRAPFPQDEYSPETLDRPRVKDWMNPNVVAVAPTTTVREACQRMVQESIHRVLVVDGGNLVGIFSSFDVVKAVAKKE